MVMPRSMLEDTPTGLRAPACPRSHKHSWQLCAALVLSVVALQRDQGGRAAPGGRRARTAGADVQRRLARLGKRARHLWPYWTTHLLPRGRTTSGLGTRLDRAHGWALCVKRPACCAAWGYRTSLGWGHVRVVYIHAVTGMERTRANHRLWLSVSGGPAGCARGSPAHNRRRAS